MLSTAAMIDSNADLL